MLQNTLENKIVLLKLNTKEEIVGKCVQLTDFGIVMEEVYSLILGNGSIQMIPFMFGNPNGEVVILTNNFMTLPMIAPDRLEESYKNATSPIERPPAGMNVSMITPVKR